MSNSEAIMLHSSSATQLINAQPEFESGVRTASIGSLNRQEAVKSGEVVVTVEELVAQVYLVST